MPPLEELYKELETIWESKILTNGAIKHQTLEARLAEHLKSPYLSLFNNGTIGLMTIIKALELTGEVITTPFTFPATPHMLSWNQITPVFCDIDPKTMNIDPKKIEEKITSKTTGILGVHVYGIPCAVNEIEQIAKKHNLKVIYDAAHAFGVEINGRGIGTFGDMSMFSFHATKLFHTAEGGAVTCNTQELKAKIDLLKNFGIKNEEEVSHIGINGKLNEIQAALGLVNLKLVHKEWLARKEIVDTYKAILNIPGITIPELPTNVKPSMQYMVIRIDPKVFGRTRDEVHLAMKEKNVNTRKYFFPLCSDYPCYQHLPSSDKNLLPEAHKASNEVLCLPLYSGLGTENALKIAEMIASMRA
jgi:dTDP-4-amino-4,6-dideoxygalactose transaminase